MIEEFYFVNELFSARTSSIQTFDSLDFARYSDDGERQVDERVAGGEKDLFKFEIYNYYESIESET